MKKIEHNSIPYLCLFAIKRIEIGDEITYFYGEEGLPWHEKVNFGPAGTNFIRRGVCFHSKKVTMVSSKYMIKRYSTLLIPKVATKSF